MIGSLEGGVQWPDTLLPAESSRGEVRPVEGSRSCSDGPDLCCDGRDSCPSESQASYPHPENMSPCWPQVTSAVCWFLSSLAALLCRSGPQNSRTSPAVGLFLHSPRFLACTQACARVLPPLTEHRRPLKLCFRPCREALDGLRATINGSKDLKVAAVRPLVLAAEENLHKMVVDLDRVVAQVSSCSALSASNPVSG